MSCKLLKRHDYKKITLKIDCLTNQKAQIERREFCLKNFFLTLRMLNSALQNVTVKTRKEEFVMDFVTFQIIGGNSTSFTSNIIDFQNMKSPSVITVYYDFRTIIPVDGIWFGHFQGEEISLEFMRKNVLGQQATLSMTLWIMTD